MMTGKQAETGKARSDFSVPVFLFSLLCILTLGQVLLRDGDTGFHIRIGELILQEGKLPDSNPFSLLPVHLLVNHEWLSQVLMAFVHQLSGLSGIVILYSILISLTNYLLFLFLQYRSNSLIALSLIVLISFCALPQWMARPHVFTNLMMGLFLIAAELYRESGNRKYLYALPLLTVLWANLHAGVIFGVVLLSVFAAGLLLKGFFEKNDAGDPELSCRRQGIILVIAAVACTAACLLTPSGLELLLHPFRIFFDMSAIQDATRETRSPDFHMQQSVLVYILLFAFCLYTSRKEKNWPLILLALFFLKLGLYSRRHLSLFIITSSPLIAAALYQLLSEMRGRGWAGRLLGVSDRLADMDRRLKGPFISILAVIAVLGALAAGKFHYDFPESVSPRKAISYLLENKLPGQIFNRDEFGDFLIYYAWPEIKVFTDTRWDVYGTEIMEDYQTIVKLKPQWKEKIDQYGFSRLMIQSGSPLAAVLEESREWKNEYEDKVAVIYGRRQ